MLGNVPKYGLNISIGSRNFSDDTFKRFLAPSAAPAAKYTYCLGYIGVSNKCPMRFAVS